MQELWNCWLPVRVDAHFVAEKKIHASTIVSIVARNMEKKQNARGILMAIRISPVYAERGFGSSSSAPPCALRKWPRTANGRLPAKWVIPKSNTRAPATFLTKGAELGY